MNVHPSGQVAADPEQVDLGRITAISGSGAHARLLAAALAETMEETRLTIGRLVGISVGASLIVGVVARMSLSPPEPGAEDASALVAEIDFMGEIRHYGSERASFQRGISNYPIIGSRVTRLATGDIAVIHRIADGETIEIGRLKLDPTVPAYINFEEMLRKHFAVVGTTGVGKSSAVALILAEILAQKANLRVFLIDPHNEYGHCFGEMAHVISPKTSRCRSGCSTSRRSSTCSSAAGRASRKKPRSCRS
jgi:uncharacterized protein